MVRRAAACSIGFLVAAHASSGYWPPDYGAIADAATLEDCEDDEASLGQVVLLQTGLGLLNTRGHSRPTNPRQQRAVILEPAAAVGMRANATDSSVATAPDAKLPAVGTRTNATDSSGATLATMTPDPQHHEIPVASRAFAFEELAQMERKEVETLAALVDIWGMNSSSDAKTTLPRMGNATEMRTLAHEEQIAHASDLVVQSHSLPRPGDLTFGTRLWRDANGVLVILTVVVATLWFTLAWLSVSNCAASQRESSMLSDGCFAKSSGCLMADDIVFRK